MLVGEWYDANYDQVWAEARSKAQVLCFQISPMNFAHVKKTIDQGG